MVDLLTAWPGEASYFRVEKRSGRAEAHERERLVGHRGARVQSRRALGPARSGAMGFEVAPTAVAGTGAGANPPAPVVVAGSSDDFRGTIQIGTGSSPASSFGQMAVMTFGDPGRPFPRNIHLRLQNGSSAALGNVYGTTVTDGGGNPTGIAIVSPGALTAAKAADNTGYVFTYSIDRQP